MAPTVLLVLCLQQLVHIPSEINPVHAPPSTSSRSTLISFSNLRQGPPNGPIPSHFSAKISSLQDNNSIINRAVKRVFNGTA
jgi:hypothetical protein